MNQKIESYHLDEEHHWVADLVCGHKQHVRHHPPLISRPWVLTEDGRNNRIGTELNCKRCDEVGLAVAEAVRRACFEAAARAYEDAGLRGLCQEGRWDVALDAVRSLDLLPLVRSSLTPQESGS